MSELMDAFERYANAIVSASPGRIMVSDDPVAVKLGKAREEIIDAIERTDEYIHQLEKAIRQIDLAHVIGRGMNGAVERAVALVPKEDWSIPGEEEE